MIHFQNVAIGYNQTLLEVEDLTLHNGNVFALVGRNGSGKSTLLRSITGQIPLLEGKLTIDSIPIAGANASELSRTVAFVESKFDGVPYLSVADYLALGRAPFTDAFGRLTSKDWQLVQNVASDLNIAHLLDKYTDQISDGERQLCSVGRAFVQETPVVLLDEPTAFLDYINRKNLLELLVRLAREKNKCIVLSTHDLDLCLDQSIPFLLAAKGEIVLHETLTKDEILSAMS